MVCFVPIVCLSIRKSCQRRDCSDLGTVRNWVDHCISFDELAAVLQVIRDKFGIIIHFLPRNIFCDPSLEPSQQDGSNEGSHHMSSLRNKYNHL